MVATRQQEHQARVAREFMECASRAFLGYSDRGQQLLTMPIPAVVCYAFSAEVSLKLIFSFHGPTPRSHDVAHLFRQLPAAEKREIRTRTRWVEADFLKELGRIANAFVDWRYVYESPNRSLNLLFLKQFATACQERTLEVCPATPPLVRSVTLK